VCHAVAGVGDCINKQPTKQTTANAWNCSATAENGTECTTTCAVGYEGTPTAVCYMGSWVFKTATACSEFCIGICVVGVRCRLYFSTCRLLWRRLPAAHDDDADDDDADAELSLWVPLAIIRQRSLMRLFNAPQPRGYAAICRRRPSTSVEPGRLPVS
jgi:hypothetical protein